MPRQTATTALTPTERKARVDALVAAGKLSPERAKLIDFREPGPKQRAHAKKLVGKGMQALARACGVWRSW